MVLRTLVRRGVVSFVVAAMAVATWTPTAAQAGVNDSPGFLVVYDTISRTGPRDAAVI